MSTIAAPRPASPPPVSYLNAWWAVVQSMLTGLIILTLAGIVLMLIGDAAALPLGVPGSSWTPVEGLPDLFAWPFDPSILWFRLVDLLALVTVVLWLGRRLRERFLVIGVRLRLADTVPAVAGLIAITAISHAAGAVAVFVVAGLLRRADTAAATAAVGEGRGCARWMAAVWVVALLGSLVAVNLVPVGEQSGASCSVSGGSVQPAPNRVCDDAEPGVVRRRDRPGHGRRSAGERAVAGHAGERRPARLPAHRAGQAHPAQHPHDVRARAVHVMPPGDERPHVHARHPAAAGARVRTVADGSGAALAAGADELSLAVASPDAAAAARAGCSAGRGSWRASSGARGASPAPSR